MFLSIQPVLPGTQPVSSASGTSAWASGPAELAALQSCSAHQIGDAAPASCLLNSQSYLVAACAAGSSCLGLQETARHYLCFYPCMCCFHMLYALFPAPLWVCQLPVHHFSSSTAQRRAFWKLQDIHQLTAPTAKRQSHVNGCSVPELQDTLQCRLSAMACMAPRYY